MRPWHITETRTLRVARACHRLRGVLARAATGS